MRDFIKPKRWAYLAGLIDGDGSISLTQFESPKQWHFFFNLKVTSTHRSQINWLVEQFGGQLERIDPKHDNWNICFNWKVKEKKHAAKILEGVLPYLVQKKPAATKALEYVTLPFGYEDPALRTQFAKEICDLNNFNIPAADLPWTMVLEKPSVLTKEDIAYTAGLLDSEGTFSVPTPTATSPQIQFSNTDKRLLDWLYYRLGGIVFSTKRSKAERRDAGLWRFSGGRCQTREHLARVKKAKELFLLAILPYLVQKRRQAILALALIRGEKPPTQCFDEMKKLNAVGTQTTNTPNNPDNGLMIEPDPVGDYGSASLVTAVA